MSARPTALIIGASRGLGLGLAREYTRRGWQVVATVRDAGRHTGLHDLKAETGDAVVIESVDTADDGQIAALRQRLDGRRFDLLFVNAGVTNNPAQLIGEIATEEFVRIMVTNTLGPMRVIETFIDAVSDNGQVAVMSSGLGSITDNNDGNWEAYRASKAALNMLMRSFVARRRNDARTFFAIAPGWVRTDMGGSDAPLDIDTSIPGVADAIRERTGQRGLVYVNYRNEILPW